MYCDCLANIRSTRLDDAERRLSYHVIIAATVKPTMHSSYFNNTMITYHQDYFTQTHSLPFRTFDYYTTAKVHIHNPSYFLRHMLFAIPTRNHRHRTFPTPPR